MTLFSNKFKSKIASHFLIACLLASSSAYAGNGVGDKEEEVSGSSQGKIPKRKPDQDLTGDEGGSSKRQKLFNQQTILIPEIWKAHVLPNLSIKDLRNFRLVSKEFCSYASDIQLWQERLPKINLSEVWSGGPKADEFTNVALNTFFHFANMRLVLKLKPENDLVYGISHRTDFYDDKIPSTSKMLKNLDRIVESYPDLKEVVDCYRSVLTGHYNLCLDLPLNGQSICKNDRLSFETKKMSPILRIVYGNQSIRFADLANKGDAEKSLTQLMCVLNGLPDYSEFRVNPSSVKAAPFVNRILNECRNREIIFSNSSSVEAKNGKILIKSKNISYDLDVLSKQFLEESVFLIPHDYVQMAFQYGELDAYDEGIKFPELLLKWPHMEPRYYNFVAEAYGMLQESSLSAQYYDKFFDCPTSAPTENDCKNASIAFSEVESMVFIYKHAEAFERFEDNVVGLDFFVDYFRGNYSNDRTTQNRVFFARKVASHEAATIKDLRNVFDMLVEKQYKEAAEEFLKTVNLRADKTEEHDQLMAECRVKIGK